MAFPGPFGTPASETLSGGPGDDSFDALGGNDWIGGLAGNDSLTGGDGNDTLLGHQDDDTLTGSDGFDLLWGGDGNDHLFGGDADDTLQGDYGQDQLYGGEGSDALRSGSDRDSLYGDGGDDGLIVDFLDQVAYGGDGNDRFAAGLYGWTTTFDLDGGAGDDAFYVGRNSQGALDGGDGTQDLLELFWYSVASPLDAVVLTPDLATVADLSVTLSGIERFIITTHDGNDTITTADGADVLVVLNGANVVDAGGGDDSVFYLLGQTNDLDGGHGNDLLRLSQHGAAAIDFTVTGGTVVDGYGSTIRNFERFEVTGTAYGDQISLGTANDIGRGWRGNDTLYGGDGDDTLNGGAQNDTCDGGTGDDQLLGGQGDDVLYGAAGRDRLFLTHGTDTGFGGSGDDRFTFGAGGHLAWGEEGRDQFVFRTIDGDQDWIGDFTSGQDRLMIWGSQLPDAPSPGRISADDLAFGTMQTDAPQFLLLGQSSQSYLFWDPDGSALDQDAILIAIFLDNPTLLHSDIVIL
jgi:Ca2+-binding RTX toxin-like protein